MAALSVIAIHMATMAGIPALKRLWANPVKGSLREAYEL